MQAHLQTLHGGDGLTLASVKRVLLGTTAKTSDETGYTKLLWLQKISNHSTIKPTNRKLTKGANRRIGTIQVHRRGFRLTS